MVNTEEKISIKRYVNIFYRHKLVLFLSFLLVSLVGTLVSFSLPNQYRSSTLILVEPQKIPQNYVQTTVSVDIEDRLNTLTTQVLSRTRLERVIREFNLYNNHKSTLGHIVDKIPFLKRIYHSGKMKKKAVSQEDRIKMMRKSIILDVKGFKGGKSSYFSISYSGKNPKLVMDVTNKLASLFIDENLKVRETQVRGTTKFLEKELTSIKAKLEEKEEALKTFKQMYMGELPEQQSANLRIMDQLELRLQTVDAGLRNASDRKMLAQSKLNEFVSNYKELPAKGNRVLVKGMDGKMTVKSPLEVELDTLKARLSDLRTRYTDRYPEIRSLKRNIEKLERNLELERKNKPVLSAELPNKGKKDKETPALREKGGVYQNDAVYIALKRELDNQEIELSSLKREKSKLKRQIKEFQQRVENTPLREQQLTTLTRDYEIMKGNYQSLLGKKYQATLSENLEIKQKGEQFRILDPANFPEEPFSPNRMKLTLLSLLLGLGFGVGLTILLEYLDTSFHEVEDIEEFTKLQVLATIPKIRK